MFTIDTDFLNDRIKVKINSKDTDIQNIEYAFYLYRNDIREKVLWYQKDSNIEFDINGEDGIYYVEGFVRNSINKDLIIIVTSEVKEYVNFSIIEYIKPAYNITMWNRKVFKMSIESFNEDFSFQNGIYQFDIGNQNLDLLLQGVELFEQSKGILVGFSGAVAKREKKYAPFFSGLNVANTLGMPLISVADPSLSISNRSNLAWYAGNYLDTTIPEKIAQILQLFATKLNAKLIMFGGSAGGFAILNIVHYMNAEVFGAVWNPQTSISKYNKQDVLNYIDSCFPDSQVENDLYCMLDKTGVTHDLTKLYNNRTIGDNIKLLYLQNIGDDMHLKDHAMPFLKVLELKKEGEYIYYKPNNICLWIKYWGDGHITPSIETVIEILKGAIENKNPLEIALNL